MTFASRKIEKLTAGQRKFLDALYEEKHLVAHRKVVQPLFDAGLIFPRPGNFLFFVVGCNGHLAADFYLLPAGRDALFGQMALPLAA
jgi:hypothetical protein